METKKGVLFFRIAAVLLLLQGCIRLFLAIKYSSLRYECIFQFVISIMQVVTGIIGFMESKKTTPPKNSISIAKLLSLVTVIYIIILLSDGYELTGDMAGLEIILLVLALPFVIAAFMRKSALASAGSEATQRNNYMQPQRNIATVAPSLKCKNCGVNITAGSKFCNECGAVVEQEPPKNICNNCGAEMPPEAKRCGMCGGAL
jgi:hypothetical protein